MRVTEVEMAACTATSLGLREVGGVAMDAEDHITGCVADGSVRVGGGIVEELGNGFCCGFGSFGLRCSKPWWDQRHGRSRGTCQQFVVFWFWLWRRVQLCCQVAPSVGFLLHIVFQWLDVGSVRVWWGVDG